MCAHKSFEWECKDCRDRMKNFIANANVEEKSYHDKIHQYDNEE